MSLSSTSTKDSLTIYLSDQLTRYSTTNVMTTKRKDVMANNKIQTMTGSSTQEKADTLMIFHAVEAARNGLNVHIYSQDTNVLLLAVRRTSLLGIHSALIIASSERRQKIFFSHLCMTHLLLKNMQL